MKALIISITLSLSFSGNSQLIQSSCIAHDSVIEMYQDDATYLTLRRFFETGSNYKDSIDIPQNYVDTILNAMVAVYNVNGIPERDTVISIYAVNPLYDTYALHSFSIAGDSDLIWMQELQMGNITSTGFVELDNLVSNYGFTQTSYHSWPWWYHTSVLYTPESINIYAATAPLVLSPEVYHVSPQFNILDGPDIECDINVDHVELRYIYRWGDCPSGCMAQRTWVFKVYYNCTVEFVTSYDGLPPNASLENMNFSEIKIGPNPCSNSLSISGLKLPYNYTVTNSLGMISKSKVNCYDQKIDVSELENGMYYLLVTDNYQSFIQKFIKE